MFKYNKNKWFTIVEIMIYTFILTIILIPMFSFITDIFDTINQTQEKNEIEVSLWEFENAFLSYVNQYSEKSIIEWSWSDILFLKNINNSKWLLLWNISRDNMKLDSNKNIYWEKSIWLYNLSSNQINDILNNSWSVYNLEFFKDKLYNFYVKDIDIQKFNSWTIINVDINIIKSFNNSFLWQDWNQVPNNLYKVNITF